MTTRQPRYSAEETARRGDAIYERDIRAQVEPGDAQLLATVFIHQLYRRLIFLGAFEVVARHIAAKWTRRSSLWMSVIIAVPFYIYDVYHYVQTSASFSTDCPVLKPG